VISPQQRDHDEHRDGDRRNDRKRHRKAVETSIDRPAGSTTVAGRPLNLPPTRPIGRVWHASVSIARISTRV
jgi:hypothetical protein